MPTSDIENTFSESVLAEILLRDINGRASTGSTTLNYIVIRKSFRVHTLPSIRCHEAEFSEDSGRPICKNTTVDLAITSKKNPAQQEFSRFLVSMNHSEVIGWPVTLAMVWLKAVPLRPICELDDQRGCYCWIFQ